MAAPRGARHLPAIMSDGHVLGRRGESIAAEFLIQAGWTVVARNFRFGHKEIDLVVRRGRTVAFVEVKARSGTEYGHPLAAITAAKRAEVQRVARAWIARFGRIGDVYRFDAIGIVWSGNSDEPALEHIEDAWRVSRSAGDRYRSTR